MACGFYFLNQHALKKLKSQSDDHFIICNDYYYSHMFRKFASSLIVQVPLGVRIAAPVRAAAIRTISSAKTAEIIKQHSIQENILRGKLISELYQIFRETSMGKNYWTSKADILLFKFTLS
ncbi:MAG: hypothetical protein Hyperionvirus1_160 [Hyperionvirus sp.]|uniref:Uncharacterized protein n=1 Tax=Hyperionvirus sp. TaxID=2487770 RepID=A0A3G5A8S7_9VIRU|nr:MAG: hypothetical protein Hyperionvirus1_160 [Hyperionvirus sp.]